MNTKKQEVSLLLRRTNERLTHMVRSEDLLFQEVRRQLTTLFKEQGLRKSSRDFRNVRGIMPGRPYVMVKLSEGSSTSSAWLMTTATPQNVPAPATLHDTRIIALREKDGKFEELTSGEMTEDILKAINHFSMPSMIFSFLDHQLRQHSN